MFLYRRDPLGRILSKVYAERTKVWGPSHIDKAENDAEAFVEPLDVDQLLKEETRNIDWLNRTWKELKAAKATLATLAYEDLYGPDADKAALSLARLLGTLNLSQGIEKDAAMLADLRGTGDQNTRDRYARFQGREALRAGLAGLPELRCAL
jgi:LPS sulfotransferase NodH